MKLRGFLAALFGASIAPRVAPKAVQALKALKPHAIASTPKGPLPFKIGETIIVRKPARFIARDGLAYRPEPIVLDEFQERYLAPAVEAICRNAEADLARLYWSPPKMRVRFNPARLPA